MEIIMGRYKLTIGYTPLWLLSWTIIMLGPPAALAMITGLPERPLAFLWSLWLLCTVWRDLTRPPWDGFDPVRYVPERIRLL